MPTGLWNRNDSSNKGVRIQLIDSSGKGLRVHIDAKGSADDAVAGSGGSGLTGICNIAVDDCGLTLTFHEIRLYPNSEVVGTATTRENCCE